MLAPLAVFRLMRRKLILVDLNVDPLLARQYQVAKQLYMMLSEDFEFAALEPKLSSAGNGAGIDAPWDAIGEDERAPFDWRGEKGEASDQEVLVEPFEVAREYLRQHLGSERQKAPTAV